MGDVETPRCRIPLPSMMGRRIASLVCLLFAPACASPNVVATLVPVLPPASAPQKGPSRTALSQLTEAVRTYLEDGKTSPLFGMYAADLIVRAGRAKAHSPRDIVFGRERLEAIYDYATRHEPGTAPQFTNTVVEERGNRTTIEWIVFLDGPTAAAFGERYELVADDKSLSIVRFEYWPLRPDTLKEFGSAYFTDVDSRIEEARSKGDDRMVAYLLMAAWRFEECAKLTRELTIATPEEPWVWTMRAKASAIVGDRVDAENAAREATKRATEH